MGPLLLLCHNTTDSVNKGAQCQLTSSDVVALRVFGMITVSTFLLLVVGGELAAVDTVDGDTAAVAVGDADRPTAGATAGTDVINLPAGISCGSVIARLWDNAVMVSAGRMAVWLMGATLGTC